MDSEEKVRSSEFSQGRGLFSELMLEEIGGLVKSSETSAVVCGSLEGHGFVTSGTRVVSGSLKR